MQTITHELRGHFGQRLPKKKNNKVTHGLRGTLIKIAILGFLHCLTGWGKMKCLFQFPLGYFKNTMCVTYKITRLNICKQAI